MKTSSKIKLPKKLLLFWIMISVLLLASTRRSDLLFRQGWGLLSFEIIFLALIFFYWAYENSPVSSRGIAIIAVLSTVAAVGRVPFAMLPSVQPTTFLVIISGFVFGPQSGFMVGSTAALVSNFFLGQGPWTPWQMFSWGLAGSAAGLIKIIYPRIGRWEMAMFHFLWGYLFGLIMNLWFWTAFISPLSLRSLLMVCAASFWFDTFHALGNIAFYLLFGAGLVKMLERFCRKLEVDIIRQGTFFSLFIHDSSLH